MTTAVTDPPHTDKPHPLGRASPHPFFNKSLASLSLDQSRLICSTQNQMTLFKAMVPNPNNLTPFYYAEIIFLDRYTTNPLIHAHTQFEEKNKTLI